MAGGLIGTLEYERELCSYHALSSQSASTKRVEPVVLRIGAVYVRHSEGCSWVPSNVILNRKSMVFLLSCDVPTTQDSEVA